MELYALDAIAGLMNERVDIGTDNQKQAMIL